MSQDERDRLTRIESKLDLVLTPIQEKVEEHEDFISNLKGKLAVVGSGFVLLGSILSLIIEKVFEYLWRN